MSPCRAKATEELARLRRQKMAAPAAVGGTAWLYAALRRTARAALAPTAACSTDLSLYADPHMLSDIGLPVDAIRDDPPRQVWPH